MLMAERLCPMLAGPALIEGACLTTRTAHEEVTVDAPRHYLKNLFTWCDGARSLSDISTLAKKKWGDEAFVAFVHDLLEAGVLVDAASVLAHTARMVRQPSGLGRVASKALRVEGLRTLPFGLPEGSISLPTSSDSPLKSLLTNRRSGGGFVPGALDAGQLSAFLTAAYGQAGPAPAARRTVASGGGLYQLRLTLVLQRAVDVFRPGVYRVDYSRNGNVGLRLVTEDLNLLPRAITQPDALQESTGWLVVSVDLELTSLKYRNRAYPLALLETGAVLQNIALACAQMEHPCVGWRPIAAYEDAPLIEVCQLDAAQIILAAGIFGVTDSARKPAATLTVDFSWMDGSGELPFFLAKARIVETIGLNATTLQPNPVRQADLGWGRDADPAVAVDKSIAEAVERYACEQAITVVHENIAALPDAIDPRQLLVYCQGTYRSKQFPFFRFDPHASYAWVLMQRADGAGTAHVMADFVAYPGTFEQDGKPYTTANTSGCASGTSLALALESASMELVERDAVMRHWLSQCGGLDIRRQSIPSDLQSRLKRLEDQGCKISVQILNKAILPVFFVMLQNTKAHFTVVGSAASLADPRAAFLSALQEAETGAHYRLSGAQSRPLHPREVRAPRDHADLYAQPRYFRRADALLSVEQHIDFSQVSVYGALNVRSLFELLRAKGHVVWWRDISVSNAPRTLSAQKIFTVRAVAPGLVPMKFGFGNTPSDWKDTRHPEAKFPHPFP